MIRVAILLTFMTGCCECPIPQDGGIPAADASILVCHDPTPENCFDTTYDTQNDLCVEIQRAPSQSCAVRGVAGICNPDGDCIQ